MVHELPQDSTWSAGGEGNFRPSMNALAIGPGKGMRAGIGETNGGEIYLQTVIWLKASWEYEKP